MSAKAYCDVCYGKGTLGKNPCLTCNGSGLIPAEDDAAPSSMTEPSAAAVQEAMKAAFQLERVASRLASRVKFTNEQRHIMDLAAHVTALTAEVEAAYASADAVRERMSQKLALSQKMHGKTYVEASALHQSVVDLTSRLAAAEKERDGLREAVVGLPDEMKRRGWNTAAAIVRRFLEAFPATLSGDNSTALPKAPAP